ncbi:putative DNA-binding transcriptional regulator [Ewingella americana]|uniref:Putative DNA-binding transcriptional regulator n=1 Tax=Ewingella americana TaxID=41202 RepID=A0A377NK02_9GAMM|nr:putative DNA-binding transcriptional regulator [Ewingella americana]
MSELADLLRQGSLTAKEIMAQIGVSQATLSRRLAEQSDVRKIGRGKSTRYALLRPVGGESEFPLYRIDTQGHAEQIGSIVSIWPAESCAFETADGQCALFDGLPWFITDMRPQGFLGRAWGRDVSALLALPEDIKLWNESQTLLALSRHGNETVGNLIVGQAAYQQWALKPDESAVAWRGKISAFEDLAQKSLAGKRWALRQGGNSQSLAFLSSIRRSQLPTF